MKKQRLKSKLIPNLFKVVFGFLAGLFAIVVFGLLVDGEIGGAIVGLVVIGLCVFGVIKLNKQTKSINEHNTRVKEEKESQAAAEAEHKANMLNDIGECEMFSCGKLQPPGTKPFGVAYTGIVYGQSFFAYNEIESIVLATAPTVATLGVAQMKVDGKVYQLCYKFADRERAAGAIARARGQVDAAKGVDKGWKYCLYAHTGTTLEVYDTYLILNFMRTGGISTMAANVLSGGVTGGKRINFADITAIQFKEPAGVTVGFLQFAYPGSGEVRGSVAAAINDENAIPVSPQNLEEARKIVDFIENKRSQLKSGGVVTAPLSSADELKKYKELLDSGVLTQEEFDAKKAQLLGL